MLDFVLITIVAVKNYIKNKWQFLSWYFHSALYILNRLIKDYVCFFSLIFIISSITIIIINNNIIVDAFIIMIVIQIDRDRDRDIDRDIDKRYR